MTQHLNRIQKDLVRSLSTTLSSFRAPESALKDIASDLYESLNTPISLSCEILLRYGELAQLVSKSLDFDAYLDPFSLRDDYQAVSFLKKVPFKHPDLDPKAKAIATFHHSEEACKDTNSRFRDFMYHGWKTGSAVEAIVMMAAAEIHNVLGPSVPYREWFYACRFGPGVFVHSKARGLTSLYDKLQVTPSATSEWGPHGAVLVKSSPPWARSVSDSDIEGFWPLISEKDIDLVPGNRITFVPKTAVTMRSIAIEPLLNIYAQLGLGMVLRRKLRRSCGIDLDDQSPNQEAARIGSIDGSLATIDLSSASDTVAREFVRFMLPDNWFQALDVCRSKSGLLEGKWIRYEKFSSMGNGYTFELETLLYWSLARSVCRYLDLDSDIVVYGDDIVVPSSAYDILVHVLNFCGFSVNPKKSFKSGYFRESCGKDWYRGMDVRPFFQKESLDEISSLIRLANGIRNLASRRNNSLGCDIRLRRVWNTVLRTVPRSVTRVLRVPRHAGDSDGIKSNFDEASVSPLVNASRHGWEGIYGPRLQATPVRVLTPTNMLGVIAEMLYRQRDGGKRTAEPSPPRLGRNFVYRLQPRAFYGPWTDYGAWF